MTVYSGRIAFLGAALAALVLAGAARASGEGSEQPLLVAEASSQRNENARDDSAESSRARQESAEANDVAVVYQPPRRGAPHHNVGAGGVRGAFARPKPLVMAPDHVGQTMSATPSLFWYIDGSPGEDVSVVFTLNDEVHIEPLAEVKLPTPKAAGIHRIHLGDHGVELAPNIDYEWSIALVGHDERRPQLAVSVGYVRRVASPAELSAVQPKAADYARAGLWYDALAALSDAIEMQPEDTRLREQRRSLLRQAKLEAAVD